MIKTYVTKEGETLLDVVINATGTNTNLDTILEANGFTDWNPTLFAGQSIIIPDTVENQSNTLTILADYPVCNNIATNIENQINQIISIFANDVIFDDITVINAQFDNDSNQALFN